MPKGCRDPQEHPKLRFQAPGNDDYDGNDLSGNDDVGGGDSDDGGGDNDDEDD